MTELVEKDIMLAEDDNDDATIFEMALNELQMPYLLRRAEDGEVLFVLLKNKIPYILFLDIHLPCRDGVACIQEIRKHREYDQLPVIMYTSYSAKTVIDETFRAGANLFVTKAESFNELVKKLKSIFAIDWKNYLHFPPGDQFVLS